MKVKILNEFGITPTNNHVSAGADFYIPYFDKDKIDIVFEAFTKSYKIDFNYINNVRINLKKILESKYEKTSFVFDDKFIANAMHLFFALHSAALETYNSVNELGDKLRLFVNRYLIFDKEMRPGINMELNDTILINSGIRVALEHGTAGIFFNKSGKGNAGFDVRAQVVDEDYTGFVHCSLAFTKDTISNSGRVFCGDKITQMVILPVYHADYEEIDSNEYYDIMANSERGSNSFGSGDIKH